MGMAEEKFPVGKSNTVNNITEVVFVLPRVQCSVCLSAWFKATELRQHVTQRSHIKQSSSQAFYQPTAVYGGRTLSVQVEIYSMQLILTNETRTVWTKMHNSISIGYLECSSMQMVKDDFLKVGFNFVHLTQYDAALTFNLLLSEDAVLDDVR